MTGKNALIVFLLTFISLDVCAQQILKDDYYMVSVDDTKLFRQSNDTIYLYKCSPDFIQLPHLKASDHYKILNINTTSNFSILKLEKLDSIQLTTDPYPLKRYCVLILKDINYKTSGQLMLYRGLSREDLNKVKIPDLSNKFFSTLISESYKKELIKLKPILVKQDVDVIIQDLKSEKYKSLIERYKATELNDMYNFFINSEMLYLACKDNGYNPINASHKIGALLKK